MAKVQKPTVALGRKKGNRKEGGKERKVEEGEKRRLHSNEPRVLLTLMSIKERPTDPERRELMF